MPLLMIYRSIISDVRRYVKILQALTGHPNPSIRTFQRIYMMQSIDLVIEKGAMHLDDMERRKWKTKLLLCERCRPRSRKRWDLCNEMLLLRQIKVFTWSTCMQEPTLLKSSLKLSSILCYWSHW
ncbi:uncharacterized protein LOC131616915 [Vicia villosa]|uniref:uncharacterized protein LOC131616915 n=1 Tax=Vicia villosa TaxID=3911 RepID=UPI00273C82A4|nr:uncharacterized protein LOC131616915 [Vicia villosa]XP_058744340.1 uncharacterized protein LOC131616915 [Vicia villosa]